MKKKARQNIYLPASSKDQTFGDRKNDKKWASDINGNIPGTEIRKSTSLSQAACGKQEKEITPPE